MIINGIKWLDFQNVIDKRGRLTAIEGYNQIPFQIARVFYVHQVVEGTDRGGHAHRDTDQVLTCINGSMKVDASDGSKVSTFILDNSDKGIYVPRMVYVRLYDFSPDAVLLVLANTIYDSKRSLRTWNEYLTAKGLPDGQEPFKTIKSKIIKNIIKPKKVSQEVSFRDSALIIDGCISLNEFEQWLNERRAANTFSVTKIHLSDLQGWHIEQDTGNLVHESRRFFQIVGLNINTNFGQTPHWMQPIINQPEIGVLGFLTKKIGGILHFLVQAKMEPGNINTLQLSPTVQATQSNFNQVHGGKKPPYLEYFLDRTKAKVLVDQLQSEQGARFLCKRNRNMIVEIAEKEEVQLLQDFCWLTLGQLFELLQIDNLVNMDSRTVLSCIRFASLGENLSNYDTISGNFFENVYLSSISEDRAAMNGMGSIISWLTHLKTHYELKANCVTLKDVKNWIYDGEQIRHKDGKFFSVIGVSVQAGNREVGSWQQPLIESCKGGVLAFICQKKKNLLHFLVQGKVEPGNLDCLEMAPTLQCTPSNYNQQRPDSFPPFYEIVMNARPEQVRYSTLQSEEGGRFYHDENKYMIVELDENYELEVPINYIWMTLAQMKEFIRFNNYFNIEARGLISCLGFKENDVASTESSLHS